MLGCEIVEKSKIAFRARAPGRRNPHSSSSPGKPDTWQRGVGDPMAGTWRDAKCKLPRRSSPSTEKQRIGPLESRMTRKCPVRFGGRRMEKDAAGYPVRSGSLCGRRCLMLLLTCLFENPMSRRMVAEYARLHLLMPTTAGAGCFPPAIAPRAWQSLPHALAQLGRCRYLAQQREQRIHLDQLADCHHLPLHVVEQLLVGNLLRLTCLVRRQVGGARLAARCTSAGRTTSETVPPSASCRSGAATRTRR